MTTVIDERVVEMRFNNEDFEKNVAESMSTLQKLKNALNFDSAKSLEDLGKATKGLTLEKLSESVTEATTKFSALEVVGVTALMNIANKAVDLGTNLVKSLTVDQLTEGFDKYASKTSAVQTIMAATRSEFANQAEQMEYVNEQMDKLMWFTDETSYNFLDMAGNIGKFTNNGIKLDAAVTAMQGIAQWAGISGANTQEASRAMYNFSQAMGAGAMKLQDWKSIENANMATMEFKQIAADTAVELGRLTKVADGMYSTLEGKTFSLKEFSTQLKSGWFDTDVMSETLQKYGAFTNQLYEISQATEYSATELLGMIDKYKAGTLDIAKISEETGISVQELTGYMDKLSDTTNDLGLRSFKASQEAKTFAEAIASVKDAVSSQWMKTSELIFGDYLEAKALWTGLANAMWDVFAAEGERRNETLKQWTERKSLVEAFVNVLNLAYKPLMVFREAWHSLFPDRASDRAKVLDEMTVKLKNFTEAIQPTEKMLRNLYLFFQGVFNAGKLVVNIFTAIVKAVFPVTKGLGSLFDILLQGLGYIGAFITAFTEFAEENGLIAAAVEGLGVAFRKLLDILKTVAMVVGGGIFYAITGFISLVIKAGTAISNFVNNSKFLQSAFQKISSAADKVTSIFGKLNGSSDKVITSSKDMKKYVGEANEVIAETGEVTEGTTKEFRKAMTPLEAFANVLKKIGTIAGGLVVTVVGAVKKIGTSIFSFFKTFHENFTELNANSETFFDTIRALFEALLKSFGEAGTKVSEFFKNLGIDTSGLERAFGVINAALEKFIQNVSAGKIAAIVLSVMLLSIAGAAVKLSTQIGDMVSSITGLFTNINKILKKQFAKTSIVTDIAKSFALIAASLALLTYVDQDKLKNVTILMGILMGAMTGLAIGITVLAKVIQKADLAKNVNGVSKNLIRLAASIAIISAALVILSHVDMSDGALAWAGRLISVIAMLTALTVAAGVLAAKVPQLSKGSRTLLALAGAMYLLVVALNKLDETQVEHINDHIDAFLFLFLGLSAVALAASKVPFFSAVGIVLIAASFNLMMEPLKAIIGAINQFPFDEASRAFKENLPEIVLVLGLVVVSLDGIGGIIATFAKTNEKTIFNFGKRDSIFNGISGAILGIGAGILMIAHAIKTIHDIYNELSQDELATLIKTVKDLAAFLGLFVLSLTVIDVVARKFLDIGGVGDTFMKLGIAIGAIGLGVVLLSKGMEIILRSGNSENIVKAAVVVSLLGVAMTIIAGVAGTVNKAVPAIAAVAAACIGMGIMIGEIALLTLLLSDAGQGIKVVAALGVLAVIVVMLRAVMGKLAEIQDVKTGPVAVLAGMLLILTGVLIALANTSDWGHLLVAAISLSAVMAVLALVINQVGKMNTTGFGKAAAIAAIAAVLLVVGISLKQLSDIPWSKMWPGLVAMGGTLAALVVALLVLDNFSSAGSMLGIADAMVVMAASIGILALSIKLLEGIQWADIQAGVIVIGIMLALFIGLGVVNAILPAFGVALEGVALAFLTFSAAAIGFSAAAVLIGIALDLIAASAVIFAKGLELLGPALEKLQNLPLLSLAEGLSALAESGFKMIGAAVGVAALGLALVVLGVGLTAVGLSLVIVSAGISSILIAIDSFSKQFKAAADFIKKALSDLKLKFEKFFQDLGQLWEGSKAKKIIDKVTNFGKKLAGKKGGSSGLFGGFSSELEYASPPGVFLDFLDAVGLTFDNNGGNAIASAFGFGEKVGAGVGMGLWEKGGAYVSSFVNMLGGLMGSAGRITNKYDTRSEKDIKRYKNKTGELLGITEDAGEKSEGLLDKFTNKLTDALDLNFDFIDSENFLADALDGVTDGFEGAAGAAGDYADATEKAGKGSKSAKDFIKDLTSTLEGQMNIFQKFELKTEVTAEQMLENMRSNLDAFASWSHRMAVLAERGIDQALYQKLAEMGPQSYETVNAFVQMTDEQLKEANQLFTASLAMPAKSADVVGQGYAYCGEMAAQGWSNALQQHMEEHSASQKAMEKELQDAKDTLGVQSPSTEFFDIAVNCIKGFINGITDETMLARLHVAIVNVLCFRILNDFRTELNYDTFHGIGTNSIQGLIDGMESKKGEVEAIAASIAATVAAIMALELDEHSPSKVTRAIGAYASEGLELGILDGASNVKNAAREVADGAADTLMYTTNRVQDLINSELDFNPIITPMLDLSYMRAQLEEANAMFGARQAYLYGSQNGGYPYGYGVPQINYTQNNYSPKALSRVEIYRQTQNQLNTMKGVVKANA